MFDFSYFFLGDVGEVTFVYMLLLISITWLWCSVLSGFWFSLDWGCGLLDVYFW